MQSLGEPALGPNEGCISLHPARQRFESFLLGREDRRGIGASVDFAAKNGGDQVGALRKMPIEGANADTRFLGDLANRSIHAGVREHRHGRFKEDVDVALRIGAHRPIRARPRAFLPIFRFAFHQAAALLQNGTTFRINGVRFRF